MERILYNLCGFMEKTFSPAHAKIVAVAELTNILGFLLSIMQVIPKVQKSLNRCEIQEWYWTKYIGENLDKNSKLI